MIQFNLEFFTKLNLEAAQIKGVSIGRQRPSIVGWAKVTA